VTRPRTSDEVAAALAAGRAVVALETTLIAHGLPAPRNLEVARRLETLVASEGAVAATVAVIDGVPAVGLSAGELERVASAGVPKLGVRDLPMAAALRVTGATTVASTAVLASLAGITLFATGGLGGVHRGAAETFDESNDLTTLARTGVAVVCAGVKSVLDVGATLERLETLGVGVLGYGTDVFPGFYLSDSGHRLDWVAETPEAVAEVLVARAGLGLGDRGVVVANPLPPTEQLDPRLHEEVLSEGLRLAGEAGVRGKDVTPFLLAHFHERTAGASLDVNVAIVERNAVLAARVARALVERA
jgi:pseudouridine-5'-phosphate glycosidase